MESFVEECFIVISPTCAQRRMQKYHFGPSLVRLTFEFLASSIIHLSEVVF